MAHSPEAQSTVIPPLFFRFADRTTRNALTIIPPVYHDIDPKGVRWGIAPLLMHHHDDQSHGLTLLPLFHYARTKNTLTLLSAPFGYMEDEDGHSLYALPYVRHRGKSELDAIAPIVWSWRKPRMYASAFIVAPLFWHFDDPASSTLLVPPLFGHWNTKHVSSTLITPLVSRWQSHQRGAAFTWIMPTLQFSHDPDSSTINLHPLFYSTRAKTHSHLVIAPLYWDIDDKEEDYRTTVAFPFFWRFRNKSTVHQLTGLTYYNEGRRQGQPHYQFHFFPFFAYGEPRPGDHWWTILYGLAGYQRQGSYARAQLLWLLNFQTDGTTPSP